MLATILLFVVVLGFFLPPVSIILMTALIVLPPLKAAGFDLIWFGIVMTIVVPKVHRQGFAGFQHPGKAEVGGVPPGQHPSGQQQRFARAPGRHVLARQHVEVYAPPGRAGHGKVLGPQGQWHRGELRQARAIQREVDIARKGLRSVCQARRTASSATSCKERLNKKPAPRPTRMNTCAVPVSWHMGRRPSAAMRELTRIRPIASRAAVLRSLRQASARLAM